MFIKPFKFFTLHVILLDPTKIMSFLLNMLEKQSEECCMDIQVMDG